MAASFSPKLFTFLRDLEANNDRAWFQANKERYERQLRDPALQFINDFAPHLRKISRYFVADSRPVGGSLFRIQRDTRFSKDKTPYKTNTGMYFRHVSGKDVHAPGFYLHLEPGNVFAGLGIWHPDSATATRIREAIVEDGAGWKRASRSKAFSQTWTLEGESLKRVPRGVDPDHPLADDIKRKDFTAVTRLTQREVTSAGFVERYAALCRSGGAFVRFLCRALELPY